MLPATMLPAIMPPQSLFNLLGTKLPAFLAPRATSLFRVRFTKMKPKSRAPAS